jgi:pyridoxal biosynthesis lyase PdxS
VALRPAPERRGLADGALVQASVKARLLGIPLLKVDATVVIAPADVTARKPALSGDRPAARARAAGQGLAEAVRRINEGAELLAEVRRNGAP